MKWDKKIKLWKISCGVSIASEPWWITSGPSEKLGVCRTYLLLGISMNEYTEMRVLNLHLVFAKISVAWLRDGQKDAI